VLVLVFLVVQSVSPLPPRMLAMSTGVEDGAYHHFGMRYREILSASGVRLELRPSSGSIENLERLNADAVSVAFVQGGVAPMPADADAAPSPLRALASVALRAGVDLHAHAGRVARPAGAGRQAHRRGRAEQRQPQGRDGPVQATAWPSAAARPTARRPRPTARACTGDGGMECRAEAAAPRGRRDHRGRGAEARLVRLLLADASIRARVAGARGRPRAALRVPAAGEPEAAARSTRRATCRHATSRCWRPPRNLVVREDLHPALAYLLLEAAKQVHQSAGC
jgi:hypothetical protein